MSRKKFSIKLKIQNFKILIMHNKFLFCLLIILFFSSLIRAQEDSALINSRKQLKKVIKEKLIQKLDINEETADKFIKLFNEERKTVGEYSKEKRNIMKYLEDNPDSKDAMDKINELLAIDDKISKSRKDFIEELKKILTPQQIAKALIFQKNLRKMFYKDPGK
jgi:Spy/CpxP family protein refolding chaperone